MGATGGLAELREGGRPALARRLAELEADPFDEAALALLDEAWRHGGGAVVGLTGPPGVGKSSLLSLLVRGWRRRGRTVAVLAVDPSSRRTGGALLGDRTRLELDPEDEGVFRRSLAARDRLGGLADLCGPMTVLLRALFDRVVVETVGVGQSESEIRDLADLVILAVQPAAGDGLQFMKAGVVEIADLLLVTKTDLGAPAERTLRELRASTALAGEDAPPVLAVSAAKGEGIEDLLVLLERRLATPPGGARFREGRRTRGEALLRAAVREEWGRRGVRRLEGWLAGRSPRDGESPFRLLADFLAFLEASAPGPPAGTTDGPRTEKRERRRKERGI